MPRFDIEKIINRFAEATGQSFTKIYDEVVAAEKVLLLLREELELEKRKGIPNNFTVQVIEGRIIGQIRHLHEVKKKHALK